jgi:hypothetical protein
MGAYAFLRNAETSSGNRARFCVYRLAWKGKEMRENIAGAAMFGVSVFQAYNGNWRAAELTMVILLALVAAGKWPR